MIAVTVVTVIFITLFFCPLFIRIKILFLFKNRQVYYAVSLFGILRINSGFITFCGGTIIVHYSNKKAVAISVTSVITDDEIKISKFLRIVKANSNLFICGKSETSIYAAIILNAVCHALYCAFKNLRPQSENIGRVYLTKSDDINCLTCDATVKSNVAKMLALSFKSAIGG